MPFRLCFADPPSPKKEGFVQLTVTRKKAICIFPNAQYEQKITDGFL